MKPTLTRLSTENLPSGSIMRHIGDAISRAPTELLSDLCQFGAKYRKKFGFGFFTTTDTRHSHKILEEVKVKRLSQEKLQEDTDDIGEIVQDSLEEELVPSKSSDEVASTGQKASMRNYDLNKTPDENEIF
ncbi:hypothetical protein AHAS_Ahas07G0155900 [Arachis hypogaea]|uniref:Oxo-4-hydroxy-4-carboxy-5-ureidoimidazoline decarboxylase domain-containing protein n=1 Tax=Arachis hypogaea TaxID=3818 RepID=A0A445CHK8_ARAHY|nr:hypothetical protein Ahy_A07g036986 [Arachis hypogaea]